jgi:hypothetical protein
MVIILILRVLEAAQAVSVSWAYTDYDLSSVASCRAPHWTDCNPYMPIIQTLLE